MAFEALQRAWFSQRTLQRDERGILVDKPAGVACRGETPDFPSQGLVERVSEQGLPGFVPALALPLQASGVAWLVPADGVVAALNTSSRAGGLPAPLESSSYVVGVEDCSLSSQGRLQVNVAGRAAALEYQSWRRHQGRALLKVRGALLPEHVVAGFAAAGQPVAGTEEEPTSTRWLLHVERVQGIGVEVSAPLPPEFESWLAGEPRGSSRRFEHALQQAAAVRARLIAEQEAHRLLAEGAGVIAGLNVDRYGDYAVLELSSEEAWAEREQLADCLLAHGARGVYLKRRLRADLRKQDRAELAPALPVRGSAAPEGLCVRNASLAFSVRLGEG